MISVKPISRRKLYEELAERLRDMILNGEFAPGDALPSERELMDAFDVGRPSVRQALFVLEKWGMVEVRSGVRTRVVRPAAEAIIANLSISVGYFFTMPDGLRHFREVRQLFECALVRHAAKHAVEQDIEDLRATLGRCEALLGDPVAFYEAAESFHRKLAEIPGNPVFVVIEDAIAKWLAPPRLKVGGVGDAVALAAHQKVFEGIAAHDPDRAEEAMRAHLQERTGTIAVAMEQKKQAP